MHKSERAGAIARQRQSLHREPSGKVVCAIDIGSKNIKLVVGEHKGARIRTSLLAKETLHFGKELAQNNGVIGPAKLAELKKTLIRFKELGANLGSEKTMGVATHAVRLAANRGDVLKIAHDLGIDLEIAGSQREGVIGYLAATGGRPGRMVSELGSGSCQVSWLSGEDIDCRAINDMGYERVYRTFLEPANSFRKFQEQYAAYLQDQIGNLPVNRSLKYIALASKSMAGYVLGCSKQDTVGLKVKQSALQHKILQAEMLDGYAFSELKSTLAKADKILPGLIFVNFMMAATRNDAVVIEDTELPAGLIYEHFSKAAH